MSGHPGCTYCLGLGCQMCPTPIHPGGIGDPTEEELEIHVLRTERDLLREQLDAALLRVAELEKILPATTGRPLREPGSERPGSSAAGLNDLNEGEKE